MNTSKLIAQQTHDAYEWANKLVNSVPIKKWEEIPPVIQTNVSYQVGHLIMSSYFHSILTIKGHQMDLIQKFPIKEYAELYTDAPPEQSVDKYNPATLLNHLHLVQQKSLEIILSLSHEDFEKRLEPTPIPHPIAKNKHEALDWNIKHTMYHCGQIGMLKRSIDQRYDFGLKKSTKNE